MKDHLRFSVAYWHTMRGTGADPFGPGTMLRPWEGPADTVENAINRARVAFEFIEKLGAPFYCFHDRDVAPEGANLAETNKNLDAVVKVLQEEQQRTGIKLLWGTANLFSNPRYMHGAATSCNADAFAFAAAQVKKALEVTKELGGAGYMFWGGREGYQCLWNTDMKRELEHLAAFMHMAVDYAKKIGFTGQFYFEPKPKEPTKHQYDFDAAACINFLRAYGLADHVKLNIETNHATLAGHTRRARTRLRRLAGLPGLGRRQHGRPAAGLGHRPVPHRRLPDDEDHADDPEIRRLHHRRAELRRQGAPREFRADRPVPRPHRRHGRLRQGAEDRRRHPRRRRAGRHGQGPLRARGTAAWAPKSRPAGTTSPRWRSTCWPRATSRPTRAAARNCSRTSSTGTCSDSAGYSAFSPRPLGEGQGVRA